jgi:hypothetical protein
VDIRVGMPADPGASGTETARRATRTEKLEMERWSVADAQHDRSTTDTGPLAGEIATSAEKDAPPAVCVTYSASLRLLCGSCSNVWGALERYFDAGAPDGRSVVDVEGLEREGR